MPDRISPNVWRSSLKARVDTFRGTVSNALCGSPVPLSLSFRYLATSDFEIRYVFKKFWPGPLFSAWVGEGTGDGRYPGHDQYRKRPIFKQLALYLMITYEVYLSGGI